MASELCRRKSRRGGTDFRPVFELIRKEQEKRELQNLKALIYFTDGDGIYPRQKPDYENGLCICEKRRKNMRLVPDWAYKTGYRRKGQKI